MLIKTFYSKSKTLRKETNDKKLKETRLYVLLVRICNLFNLYIKIKSIHYDNYNKRK